MGHAYEFASPPFPFDPLLSVQYYSLASQQGEDEADMALSKWFLCGAEGAFDKDENLAYTFAEKAAKKGLATAQFALGYYAEVGVGTPNNPEAARKWYQKAAAQGNDDAQERLNALSQSNPQMLSREEHENLTDAKLVRKHTQAKNSSAAAGRAARRADDQETQRVVGVVRKTSLLHKPNRREGTQAQEPPNPGFGGPPTSYRPGPGPPGPAAGPLGGPQREHRRFPSGPGPANPRPANRREQSDPSISFPPPQQAPPSFNRRPQKVQTSPSPPMNSIPPMPGTQYSPPAPGPAPAPAPDNGPATFQEMGIHTGKVEQKECVIM